MLDTDAVLHIATVVARVGVEIVRGTMIQQISGAKVSSNIDANGYRAGRHRRPSDNANPRFFRYASTHFHHVSRPNLPLRLLLPDQS